MFPFLLLSLSLIFLKLWQNINFQNKTGCTWKWGILPISRGTAFKIRIWGAFCLLVPPSAGKAWIQSVRSVLSIFHLAPEWLGTTVLVRLMNLNCFYSPWSKSVFQDSENYSIVTITKSSSKIAWWSRWHCCLFQYVYLTYVNFVLREHFWFFETHSIEAKSVRNNNVNSAVKL